jgi:hypothetical protein
MPDASVRRWGMGSPELRGDALSVGKRTYEDGITG